MELCILKQIAFSKEYFHSAALDATVDPNVIPEDADNPPKKLVLRVWLVVPGITVISGGQQKNTAGLRLLSVFEKTARETFDLYIHVIETMEDIHLMEDIVEVMWADVKEMYHVGGSDG